MKLEIKGNKVTQEEVKNAIEFVTYHKIGYKFTVCHIQLKNGYEVIGSSACVDKNNYDFKIGSDIAFNNAKDEVWKHMGSILQDRLSFKIVNEIKNR